VPAAPSVSGDALLARQALTSFFTLLHERSYAQAVQYYGGSYDALRVWNPAVAPDDYAALFQNGCEVNGLKCLAIRTIVAEEQVSATEFSFVLEFADEDGGLFVRGPCCGATPEEMPPTSRFTYPVRKVGDRFLVQGGPVYVP